MQASPRPLERVLDGYRMQQRALTVEQLAQLAAQLHIAHLAELRRLHDYHRRLDAGQPYRAQLSDHLLRASQRAETGAAPVTWRPAAVPRNLQELFDTAPQVAAGRGWRAARGWAAGALLLLAALLLLRATDRFFTRNYLRWRRSRSEEWPAPSVLATTQAEAPPSERAPPAEAVGLECADDLPPPYSECSQKHRREEAPPPYSACYVEMAAPKDAAAAVRFYTGMQPALGAAAAGSCDAGPGAAPVVRFEPPKALAGDC